MLAIVMQERACRMCGVSKRLEQSQMGTPQDELVEEACRLIEHGYRSVRNAASSNLADLITIAQGSLRIPSQQPSPAAEAMLRGAVDKLRAALAKSKPA